MSFTKKPDNPSYVRNGSTAKLVWEYSDPQKQLRAIIFRVLVKGTFVGLLVEQNGVIKNHQEMPAAYQGRVKKEGNATLIIENISPRDISSRSEAFVLLFLIPSNKCPKCYYPIISRCF